MKKTFKFLVFMTVLLLLGGAVAYKVFLVSDFNITSSGKTVSDVFDGEISILGSNNTLRVQAGSNVETITLLGNDNRITIEEGAVVKKILGGGSNNTIVAPPDLMIDSDLLKGRNNTIGQAAAPFALDGL